MRLSQVLETTNQFEKNYFLKTLDSISCKLKDDNDGVNEILSKSEGEFKNMDHSNLIKLFNCCQVPFRESIKEKIQYNNFQLDILLNILMRDGNAIMSRDWLYKLYSDEIENLKKSISQFETQLGDENRDIDPQRKRDYNIFRECVKTAYENDILVNREKKITSDEKSILDTLTNNLDLSAEETRKIYYSVVPLNKLDIEFLVNSLKEIGLIFFKRTNQTVYVPDEFVWLLRDLAGMEISTKHFRRILRNLKDGQINRIARTHGIDTKSKRNDKTKAILSQGISIRNTLLKSMYKSDISKTDKKKALQGLMNSLDLKFGKTGVTSSEKVDLIIDCFLNLERDDNIGMSADGYERFLKDIGSTFPNIVVLLKDEFELQQEDVLKVGFLRNYGIKPMDILDLMSEAEVGRYCETFSISRRGNDRKNIINSYKDIENLYLENYTLIANRNLQGLKDKGITIKEADLGIKFEHLTRNILTQLGFSVDEEIRKTLNTARNKADIIIKLEGIELVIVECKSKKDTEYTKYTTVSRQLTSYVKMCQEKGYNVSHCIVVSNGFSDDFIAECEYDYQLHLSLVTASGLAKILEGFKDSSMKEFPKNPFRKSGLIDADRVIQVINR